MSVYKNKKFSLPENLPLAILLLTIIVYKRKIPRI